MTTPISPNDTAALIRRVMTVTWKVDTNTMNVANAVARAVCPPGHHVIADDDLRAVLDALGRHTGVMDDDGFMLDDEERIVYDRLRAKVGEAT